MEELINKNNQLIEGVIETLPNIQQSIDDTTKNYQYYIESNEFEVFNIKPDETYSDAIKRGEGIIDRIDETERRRKTVIEKGKETIFQIEIIKKKMKRIVKECNNDGETLGKTRNELIDKIISIEEMIMKNKLFRKPKERDKITAEFNKKKEEWQKQYSDYLERKKRREEDEAKERKKQEERLQRMREMIQIEEMIQLEEWTNRKVGNILFDSDKDDWNKDTSVFEERIKNKEHITIIIEDSRGNKFGGYANEKIDKVGYIPDHKSFLFSLESNGRMKRMKKFDIKQPEYAFKLYNQSDIRLFEFGFGDILVYKENNQTNSCCNQYAFEYKRIEDALCGKQRFMPKRFIVIEMK
ncbi:predicted protein [Entamoeba histolytica]